MAEPHLRTAVDFLLAHNLLLRSESRLGAWSVSFKSFVVSVSGAGEGFSLSY